MKCLAAFVLLVLAAVVSAEQVSYRNYKVYATQTTSREQQSQLKRWEDLEGVDFWDRAGKRVMVHPRLQQKFELFLKAHNISNQLIIQDVDATIEAERKYDREYRQSRIGSGRHTISFDHFWTLDEIYAYLDELAVDYPSLVTVEIVGQTHEGRDIKAITISTSNGQVSGTKPVIFIDGGIHAREWAAIMSVVYLIHELAEHSDQYADMLINEWVIVPAANPDGYEFSRTSNRMWRKNRFPPTILCTGVDLNRNWNYQWASSSNACSDTFPGSAAHSERETQALVGLMNRYSANLKLYLAVHTYGNLILYPFGYAWPSVPVSNAADHIAMGAKAAAAVSAVGGPSYTVGNSADVLYTASGASDDYAAGAAGFTYSFTLELTGGGNQGFDLPASQIAAVAGQTFEIFRSMANDI
ncbi:carboxypeptidase B-like [Topomyia yanbarensis]|uniref:carboxypeptidase B-like n=1 Tax=Topomyia yanbarensis TaxID=2498891 RepID=UPI00273C7BCE|nr:carboxypeptidase B-like [Topomyia yanbarensis]